MKKEFSTAWEASKQPRKQRKYVAKAPLHIKRKFLSANLSKDLRVKQGKRSIVVRKGDKVKIMRGKFKGKQGKVLEVFTKLSKIVVEGMQVKKTDGSKVNVKIWPSNVQIVELNLDDKKRIKSQAQETKKQSPKKEESKDKIKENKENDKTPKKA